MTAKLHLVPVLRDNPHLSTDAEFVDVIAQIASQGRLGGGEGIRAALFALYLGERELGRYGLEAASPADADRVEGVLRGIWAHNERLGRARVHREGEVLVVAWHNGVSPSCSEAVNAKVLERLTAPKAPRDESSRPTNWRLPPTSAGGHDGSRLPSRQRALPGQDRIARAVGARR